MPATDPPTPDDPPPDPTVVSAPIDPERTGTLATPDADPITIISARVRKGSFDSKIGDALAGRKLGHFEIIESIGAGGMAAVLKARDLDLGRVVALKILPPDLATDPDNIDRFRQEARAAAKLDHDNVARVYFFGEDQGLHFIAFEFVEGDNLRDLMAANGGLIPVPDAVALMLQVTAGLSHASERSVVHRDIKPSNIIVTPDGRAKIVDMGLARSMDARADGQLTASGVTLGTFDYISPEQAIEPRLADARSDIYSLGCTFYHALTGHSPVPEGTPARKLDAQKHIMPPDPRGYNPAIPDELAVVLGKMMAKDPDRRYQHPDHLSAHLRSVAKKVGVPGGEVRPGEVQLPPPRLSAAWVLTAVAVLALVVVVLSNAFGPPPEVPPEPANPVAAVPPKDLDPVVPPVLSAGVRDAATVDELVQLLKQGARHVRLTGPEYDLVRYRDRDGQPVESLLTGDEVVIDGVNDPVVRIGYAPDGKSRLKTLTLRGPGTANSTALIRHVRFVLPDVGGDAGDQGLLVAGFEKVTLEDCTFATGYRSPRLGPASVGLVLRGGSAGLTRCYFAPGCVGVGVDGPGKLTATDCVFAPQFAAVRVVRSTESAGDTDVSLVHCSAVLTATGAVVEVGDGVPCAMSAAACLFTGPDRFGPFEPMPAVWRQVKTRSPATRYAPVEGKTNGYYNVAAYAEGETAYTFAEARREGVPANDFDRPLKYPWEERDPLALLAAKSSEAAKAFAPNLQLADLRIKDEPQRVMGSRFLGPKPLYGVPLPTIDSVVRDATVKVWDPSLPADAESLPTGTYPTLAKALAAVRPGDTLLIRHNGRLDMEPAEFTKADTLLTIKPDVNCKPILVPAMAFLKRPAGLFKLYGGKLVLDGLQFRLPADRAPAVVVLPGGGQVELRNSVITMEEGDDLSAITLQDPRGEMMMPTAGGDRWPVPKVTVENVFLRGKGRLLHVKGSRPFDFDATNCLAAVDHSLIDVDPSTADPSGAGSGVVKLTRVTTILGGSLLRFQAADRKADMGPAGLARTEITATQCLFAQAGGSPDALVRADRIDTREQLEKWLTWRGRDNVYGYDKKKVVLELRPADLESMPVKPIEGDRWLELTLEEGDPFAAVSFGYRLPDAGKSKSFLSARPPDFRTARFDPPRPDGAAAVGPTSDLPVPFPDE